MVPHYMDENVHGGITEALRARQVDVLTVQEDGRAGAAGHEVLDRATQLGRVLFTRDEKDMLAEAARRQRTGEAFPGVVYAHQIRVPMRDCIDGAELISKAGESNEFRNRTMHLPL
jgi:hypothetical protein